MQTEFKGRCGPDRICVLGSVSYNKRWVLHWPKGPLNTAPLYDINIEEHIFIGCVMYIIFRF